MSPQDAERFAAAQRSSHLVSHLIFVTILRPGCYYRFHFVDGGTGGTGRLRNVPKDLAANGGPDPTPESGSGVHATPNRGQDLRKMHSRGQNVASLLGRWSGRFLHGCLIRFSR